MLCFQLGMSSIPPSTPVIPSFNHSGVLPPFLGADPAGSSAAMSPYRVSIDSFVTTYATTPERSLILQGFLKFRRDLRAIGIAGWHGSMEASSKILRPSSRGPRMIWM
jgi:hypothetical protein